MTTQYKRWVFTLNSKKDGPTQDLLPNPIEFLKVFEDESKVYSCQFQEEEGEQKRRHFQGYVTFGQKITKSGFLKWFSGLTGIEHLFIEPMRGSLGDSDRYTSKEDGRVAGPWSFSRDDNSKVNGQSGDVKSSPKRRKVKLWPVRSGDGVSNPVERCSEGRAVVICCGPAGCGKTRSWSLILEYAYGYLGVYRVPSKASQSAGRWVGEYEGEPAALIDESLFSDFQANQWKVMLDRYDTRVPAKMGGKSVIWQPDFVVLLTDVSFGLVSSQFLSDPAIKRRVSLVFNWWSADVPSHVSSGPVIIHHAIPSKVKVSKAKVVSS